MTYSLLTGTHSILAVETGVPLHGANLDKRYEEVHVLLGGGLSHVHHGRDDGRRRAVHEVATAVQLDVFQQFYVHAVLHQINRLYRHHVIHGLPLAHNVAFRWRKILFIIIYYYCYYQRR